MYLGNIGKFAQKPVLHAKGTTLGASDLFFGGLVTQITAKKQKAISDIPLLFH